MAQAREQPPCHSRWVRHAKANSLKSLSIVGEHAHLPGPPYTEWIRLLHIGTGPPYTEWITLLYIGSWAVVAGYLGGRFNRDRDGLFVAFSPLLFGLAGLAAILIYGRLSGALVYFYPLSMVLPVFFYSTIALVSYYIGLQHRLRSAKDKSS